MQGSKAAPGTSGGLSPPSLGATVHPRQASTKANSAPAPTIAHASLLPGLPLSTFVLPGPATSFQGASPAPTSACLLCELGLRPTLQHLPAIVPCVYMNFMDLLVGGS